VPTVVIYEQQKTKQAPSTRQLDQVNDQLNDDDLLMLYLAAQDQANLESLFND
jgi:hypothetical protein